MVKILLFDKDRPWWQRKSFISLISKNQNNLDESDRPEQVVMTAELLQHYLILEHLFACFSTLNYLHKTLERQSAPTARNGFSPEYIKIGKPQN